MISKFSDVLAKIAKLCTRLHVAPYFGATSSEI